ncbi:hypothetical protein EG68_02862 [Paragonimus skrjabini miyazakii]|uniref:Proteasome assembly chaperone 1 n=1 Tax=Paragonimus skrjabini miyazakii TaxID=59628 RepID=A0A8S9Z7N8_9TREM|nr:hypothetical protein EG68_02862 [Paragonimus skrjabini miyazakii]
MDFFLKRIPAFSRALGELDSDEDDSTNESTEVDHFLDVAGVPVDYEHVVSDLSFKHIIVSIGPVQTAFISSVLCITKEHLIAKLPFMLPIYGGTDKTTRTFAFVYFISPSEKGILIITLPYAKDYIHPSQKVVVDKLLHKIVSSGQTGSGPDLLVLCTREVHEYQAPSVPSESFVRVIHSDPRENDQSLPFPKLEQPNILSGFPAEFFTYAILRSIRSMLLVLYYVPQDNPGYAWQSVKELFRKITPIEQFSDAFVSFPSTWDIPEDTALKEACISLICGNKPSLMDQMYT